MRFGGLRHDYRSVSTNLSSIEVVHGMKLAKFTYDTSILTILGSEDPIYDIRLARGYHRPVRDC